MFSFKFASILISIYVLLPCISADSATFTHSITYKGDSFFDGFNFFTAPDPTHGWVDYVDATTAQQGNLTGVDSSNNVFLRPNDLDVITDPNGKRQSIRIQSKQPFTKGVVIGNFIHMPTGCGTWPAFWASTTGQWPDGGEIDIIEGVNTGEENQSTLHTNPGCTMPSERDQLGQNRKLNCDAKADGNSGCGVGYNNGDSSYGESFNNNGGGWYAMVHDDESIRVFFWKRDDPNVPKDVSNPPESGTITIDDSWGKPYAFFPLGGNCSGDNFGAESIIINTTLCGDWAGSVFDLNQCPGGAEKYKDITSKDPKEQCEEVVRKHPEVFKDAGWTIGSIHVYKLSQDNKKRLVRRRR